VRVAFYAPLKPPDHDVPSGDRRMAQLLTAALRRGGYEVELASRLRSFDGAGDVARQHRLGVLGKCLARRFIARMRDRPVSQRPRAWITYHLYYKAPDWIGPRVAAQLGIPYVVVEPSVAAKRAYGPWAIGHAAVVAALGHADVALAPNPADRAGVEPCLRDPGRLHSLKPFLDIAPYEAALRMRRMSRLAYSRRFVLPQGEPWLVTVAMMRPGDKLASYRVLGEALARLRHRPWRLLVIGDGAARKEVEAALAPVATRTVYAGALPGESLPPILAACDVFVWPAINEAYGMAILEAQAAGVPVVAGAAGGVSEIIAHDRTGLLTPIGDAGCFAGALDRLLSDDERRRTFSATALEKTVAAHDISAAASSLDRVLQALIQGRA